MEQDLKTLAFTGITPEIAVFQYKHLILYQTPRFYCFWARCFQGIQGKCILQDLETI